MTCFSMTYLKAKFQILLLASLSFGLSACIPKTQDRPDGTGSGGANFTVASISGGIVASKNVGEFPLPGERTYNFKACLIDFTRRSSIPNAKFTINELNQEYTTDAQGCLNWPETIKYNYLSDSIWLKTTRTLTASGLQRGTREVNFAINPWSHGESLNDVLDLAKQSTPYIVESADEVKVHLAGDNETRTIWIEGGEVNATNGKQDGKAYQWHDQIFLKPQIQFSKTDATPVLVPISAGSFKAEITLISEDVQNKQLVRKIWSNRTIEKATITNGTLMMDVDFALEKEPTSGQTFLGIKLSPIGAAPGLLPFEGVFPLGGSRAFTQSTGLKISQTVAAENSKGKAFSVNEFVKALADSNVKLNVDSNTTENTDHSEEAGIHIDHFHVGDFKIVSEKGQTKVLSYQNQTCLKNTVGNFGLAKRKFTIEMVNAAGVAIDSKEITSDVNSCLYWESKTEAFDVNECRHYVKTEVRIKNDDLGINQSESILINPWLSKALDSRSATDKTQYATSCDGKSGLSQANNMVVINNITLNRIVYRPEVLDRTLQLTQKIVYGVTIPNSGTTEYSNENAGLSATVKPFIAGKYLLRLAFVRDAKVDSGNGYVTHADVILDANAGTLTGKMELEIKDLQATMIRKTVLAQIFPIDAEKYNSKNWANNDPNIESLIDTKTKLISPVYANESFMFSAQGPLSFAQKAEGLASIADLITKGFKANPTSSTLIKDIVVAGEAAQKELIKKTAFNEADGKAWAKWSKEQNLDLIWLSNKPSVDYLQKQFNLKGDGKAILQNLVTMNKLDVAWANQFCHILANGPFKKLVDKDSISIGQLTIDTTSEEDFAQMFIRDCSKDISKNPSKFITKSPVYRILSMEPAQVIPQAVAVSNISVSSSFGYGKSHSETSGVQGSLSLSAGLNTGSFASAGLGASYGSVYMKTDDMNRHSGNDLSSSTTLSVTKWKMNIPVTSYQECTILRANPLAILEHDNLQLTLSSILTYDLSKKRLRDSIDLEKLFNYAGGQNPSLKGWLICSDVKVTKKIMLPETYYMISQANGDNETFDSVDELNRNFFLPLRGESDMARFKATLVDVLKYPDNGEMTDEVKSDLSKKYSPLIKRLDPAPGMILPEQ